jgi:hypothetical protein
MRENGASLYALACSLSVSLACSDPESRPPPGSDSAAGAAGAISGEGGTRDAEGGGTGLAHGGAGDGGQRETPTPAGGAASEGGEAGARFGPGGAGGEGGAGARAGGASSGGAGGEGGAHTGGDANVATTGGAPGAPPSAATAEQRALCESICAKQPLTNGFAGAPSAPCPNNESCVETFCGLAYDSPNESCIEQFTALLSCWDSLPDEAYECFSGFGLLPPYGCDEESETWSAVCST